MLTAVSWFPAPARRVAESARNKLRHFRGLRCIVPAAWLLLTFTAGCVLPPPPQGTSEVVSAAQLIGIDLDKIRPTGPGKVQVDRSTSGPIEFSVSDALPSGHKFNTYWFVNFDFATPKPWQQVTDPLTLDPCQDPLVDTTGPFQKIVTVEVLVTEGTLDISVIQPGDPRFTPDGEPIAIVRWTVVAEGACPKP